MGEDDSEDAIEWHEALLALKVEASGCNHSILFEILG